MFPLNWKFPYCFPKSRNPEALEATEARSDGALRLICNSGGMSQRPPDGAHC